MAEPFSWGGQKAGTGYRLSDSDTTRFNALVWRRMYLSMFMFTGEVRLETVGDFTVIHLPYHFRNQLDPGVLSLSAVALQGASGTPGSSRPSSSSSWIGAS